MLTNPAYVSKCYLYLSCFEVDLIQSVLLKMFQLGVHLLSLSKTEVAILTRLVLTFL